jgi:hypothetical protein
MVGCVRGSWKRLGDSGSLMGNDGSVLGVMGESPVGDYIGEILQRVDKGLLQLTLSRI